MENLYNLNSNSRLQNICKFKSLSFWHFLFILYKLIYLKNTLLYFFKNIIFSYLKIIFSLGIRWADHGFWRHLAQSGSHSWRSFRLPGTRHLCSYQSWAVDNVLASRQRQSDNAIELQGQDKIKKKFKVSVSKWSSFNEYSNNAKTNSFYCLITGHFVAEVMSRARLYFFMYILFV